MLRERRTICESGGTRRSSRLLMFEGLLEHTLLKQFNIFMREWRNWQTRTFEGRVVHTVRVQVPFLAPQQKGRQSRPFCCGTNLISGT